MNTITMLAVLVWLAVVAAPLTASAQCIEITPESWDYGDVKVGSSESQIFTLYSCADSELLLFAIEITDDDTGAFSVTSGPIPPYVIPGRESRVVEVTFTPPDFREDWW